VSSNTHVKGGVTVAHIELKKEDLGSLISDGVIQQDVVDTDGAVIMTITVSVAELAPRTIKA